MKQHQFVTGSGGRVIDFSLLIAAYLASGCASTGDPAGTGGSGGNAGASGDGSVSIDGGPAGSGGSGGGGGGTGGTEDGGGGESGMDGGEDGAVRESCGEDQECEENEACRYDTCVPDPEKCKTNDDCWTDSYCDDEGECIPYGVPTGHDRDETCRVDISIDALVPSVQCRWTGPPAGDSHPTYFQVMATPVVVDFDFDGRKKTLHPSIVFPSFDKDQNYVEPGYLRVIDGESCEQQFSFPEQIHPPAPAAVGDLDGDGRAEIVAMAFGGGLYAWEYDTGSQSFQQLWRSGTCAGGVVVTPDTVGGAGKSWAGPSIHDLDDDGKAEIIFGGAVYDSDGCLLTSRLGMPLEPARSYIAVVADVDEDGKMELVQGNRIDEWDPAANDWVAEPYFTATQGAGQVAVADMGDYPLASQGNEDRPEIVVVNPGSGSGTVYVLTIEGTVVFGPMGIPEPAPTNKNRGGAPTIADFDGDGRREFATAGGFNYVVFDFDCVGAPVPAGCESNGVLWTRPSQDKSSNVTGSSVFDFDADGAAEAVYADECFLRIYDGTTGNVVFSSHRSSGTTFENPVIVDVDGDFHTEIVSAVNNYWENSICGNITADPLFPDSPYGKNNGIVVLRDKKDRWAASRPVWNQHAYAVTHVGNLGETPRTSDVDHNWKDADLNNFRQNVQGDLESLGIQDLTVSGDVREVECEGNTATLEAEICNRGTLPMNDGTKVSFRRDTRSGKELCSVPIPTILGVAECDRVSCEADLPGGGPIDMYVMVDPDDDEDECWEENNFSVFGGVECGSVPVVE